MNETDFTCIRQIEGALIFASVVPQEDLVNTRIRLGDLEFEVKATLVKTWDSNEFPSTSNRGEYSIVLWDR